MNLRSIYLTGSLLLFVTCSALCAIYEPQGIGGGGAMTSYSISPYDQELMFVGTDMGALFRSLNGGQRWIPVDQDEIMFNSNLYYFSQLGFCADPNVVFFADAGRNPKRSLNKGETWSFINISLASQERIKYWVPNSHDENFILCATNDRLWKTTDKGNSWLPCGDIDGPSVGTFFDYTDNRIYHATRDGIYVSDDAGDSFSLYHTPVVGPVQGFAGGRDANGITLAYIDGDGVNAVGPWIQQYVDIGVGNDGASQEEYDNSVVTSGFVLVSVNGTPFGRVPHHQTYDRISAESDYLYGGGGVYLNGGVFNIDRVQYYHGGIHMAENNSQVIYVTGNDYWPRMYGNKVFVTENAGRTWEKRFHGNDWDNGYQPWPADKLEHSAVGLEVGWWDGSWDNFTVCQRNAAMAGGTGYFFLHITKDTGLHWLAPFTEYADNGPRTTGKRWRSTGLEVTTVHRIRFHPANSQIMYMGMADIGGYVSEDGGGSVRVCDTGINTNYDYAFDPDDDTVVYAACNNLHDYPVMTVSPARSSGGIYQSNDRGRNWFRVTPNNGSFNRGFLSVAYDHRRNILYGGSMGDGVARSVDGGAWEYFNAGIYAGNGRCIRQMELDDNGNVYALLTGDGNESNQAYTGIYFLDVENNAAEWELLRGAVNVPPGLGGGVFWQYPMAFAVDPNDSNVLWLTDSEETWAAWECGGVWKSTDRGQTWNRLIRSAFPYDIMIDKNNPSRVFMSGFYDAGYGEKGGLWHTTDSGATWKKNTDVPFKENAFRAVIDPLDNTKIWYGFYGSGLLHGPRPDGDLLTLQAPSALTADAVSGSRIDLTWQDNSSEENGFHLERSLSSDSGFVRIADLAADQASYSDTGLASATRYYYRVRAYDAGQHSAFSLITTAVTDGTAVEAPAGLSARPVSPTEIDLVWTDLADNEQGYVIERRLSGGYFVVIATVSANTESYRDTKLNPGTVYFYRVKGFYNAFYSNNSEEVSVLTLTPQGDDSLSEGVSVPLETGEIKVVGSEQGRGTICPDQGDKARLYFKGTNQGEFKCLIFTLSGELVWKGVVFSSGSGSFEWQPEHVQPGVYAAVINGPGINNKTKKIVVVR